SRWIAFDCYGTLVDWRTGLLGQLKHLAPELSPTDRDQWFDAYLSEERIIEAGPYLPYREVMGHAVVRAARSVGVELSPAQALEVAESIPNWPAFPDTGAALATLRANGFRIAVLSNIDSGLLDRTLSNLALPADCVVTAQEVGSYKPAWNHWIRFLKRTATLPDQVWHVSGSYEHDIEPARSLGFRTAYVERQGGAPARGDLGLSVRGLADLVDRLLADPIPS
ncbi:MAG TPA: HAD family hydrolase, partial [Thermoplasmata archaeon]|nr:HAD family hydrolase [Thermoplasmata archaeon]